MLNPVWLQTFITLIETGHFTKTAEKLFMTQPGVSQHIRKLEQSCGFVLINRDKKSFEVTEQGRLVYQHAKKSVKNEQALMAQLSFDDPHSGRCLVASSGAVALALYTQLIDLQLNYPSLVMKLKAAPNHQILADLQAGLIDIGIVTDAPNSSLFDTEVLGHEELCLVLGQPLAKNQGLAQQLTKMGVITHPDLMHYLSIYIEQSHDPHLKTLVISDIPEVGYINQISQILQPIAKGIGFTVLPKRAIESFEQAHLLTVFTPASPVIETLFIVKKKNRVLPARYSALITLLHEVLG